MKSTAKVGLIVVLTVLIALSLSVVFAGSDTAAKNNATNTAKNITNASENMTNATKNITNASENMTNVTKNATNPFAKVKGGTTLNPTFPP